MRSFHGIVRSFHIADKQGDTNTYIAELVPQLWFADQTMDCRVFHAVSSADIITTILNENGISSPKVSISPATRKPTTSPFNTTRPTSPSSPG